jgi:hypothetical protein
LEDAPSGVGQLMGFLHGRVADVGGLVLEFVSFVVSFVSQMRRALPDAQARGLLLEIMRLVESLVNQMRSPLLQAQIRG